MLGFTQEGSHGECVQRLTSSMRTAACLMGMAWFLVLVRGTGVLYSLWLFYISHVFQIPETYMHVYIFTSTSPPHHLKKQRAWDGSFLCTGQHTILGSGD